VRKLLKQKVQNSIELRSIISKSEFTNDDVKELSEKIDISLSNRFEQSLK
jgi:hypothetical protein